MQSVQKELHKIIETIFKVYSEFLCPTFNQLQY